LSYTLKTFKNHVTLNQSHATFNQCKNHVSFNQRHATFNQGPCTIQSKPRTIQ